MRCWGQHSVHETQYWYSTLPTDVMQLSGDSNKSSSFPGSNTEILGLAVMMLRVSPVSTPTHPAGRAHDRNCHQFPLFVWLHASQATAGVDWPTADTCQHRYPSARTVEKIQSSSIPLRRDWPPGRLNGASELVGSAKSPPIGPARPPNRPVPGSPEHFSRGLHLRKGVLGVRSCLRALTEKRNSSVLSQPVSTPVAVECAQKSKSRMQGRLCRDTAKLGQSDRVILNGRTRV